MRSSSSPDRRTTSGQERGERYGGRGPARVFGAGARAGPGRLDLVPNRDLRWLFERRLETIPRAAYIARSFAALAEDGSVQTRVEILKPQEMAPSARGTVSSSAVSAGRTAEALRVEGRLHDARGPDRAFDAAPRGGRSHEALGRGTSVPAGGVEGRSVTSRSADDAEQNGGRELAPTQ